MNKKFTDLETANQKLQAKAEQLVIKAIEKILLKKHWNFSSVGFDIETTCDGETVYDPKIEELLNWYQDNFGRFGFYYFENGKWIEGQTPLIKFSKPII
jgi:hypothetical protein